MWRIKMKTELRLIKAKINNRAVHKFKLYENYQFMPYKVDKYGFKKNGLSSLYVRRIGDDILSYIYKGISEDGFMHINTYEIFIIDDTEVILSAYTDIKESTVLTFKSIADKRRWMDENINYSAKFPCKYNKGILFLSDFSPAINKYLNV